MTNLNKPDVLLLFPKTGIDFGSAVAPPHSLLTIAAPCLKAGYDVRILDQRAKPITLDALRELISSDLICVGISSMSGTQIRNALSLARMVRELTGGSVPIVWGGTHPSLLPEQTLENEFVDIVVNGEGDESFLELVQALEKSQPLSDIKGILYTDGPKVVNTGTRPALDIETLLPVPWDLVNVEDYIHRDMYLRHKNRVLDLGQTSRGCPFDCGFCSSAEIRGRKWRAMSPEKSLDMIEDGVRRFKTDGFWLRDDEFYIKRKRAIAICEGLIDLDLNQSFYTAGIRCDVFLKSTDQDIETMARAGCHTIRFGAESGSQRVLDLMQKGITPEQTLEVNRRVKKYGIIPVFSMIIGYPTETFAEMNQTIDLALQLKKENPQAQMDQFSQFTAFPGTPDFKLATMLGLQAPDKLEGWANWLCGDYDFEGERTPWWPKKERIYLGNISYMSILSNAAENLAGTHRNIFLRYIGTPVAKILSAYYNWRLKKKFYKFAPELRILHHLRARFFENDPNKKTPVKVAENEAS